MSLVNLNLSLNTDRNVNKIAFCSAVVAGFAYVGYSVCRTAFSRRRSKRDDSPRRGVFLRRLSQTTQTDGLLGEFIPDGSHKIVLRPKTVQERIKDLNMRARQFASAVNEIQNNRMSRASGVSGRSLQVTPWGSPRLLSPVDVHHIIPEYSECERDQRFSPNSSPNRYRWVRTGSLKKPRKVDLDVNEDSRLKQYEELWLERKDHIIQQLSELLTDSQREIGLQEAQYFSAIFASEETPLISGALTVVSNLAAFARNQEIFREAGLFCVLPKLMLHSNGQIKQNACIVVANMAINEKNNTEMRSVTISLVEMIRHTPHTETSLLTSAFVALTNIAVLPSWHKEMKPILHKAYSLLDDGNWGSNGLSLQSLRLLINLSCNEEMIPSLLAAQAPAKLIYLIDMSVSEEIVLRVLTLLANIASVTIRMNIDPLDLPAEDKAAAPDTMYAAVFGLSMAERLKKKALILSERHANSDVSTQAHKLWVALSK